MNTKNVALLLYYQRTSRYPFNILLGALETTDLSQHIQLSLFQDIESLLKNIQLSLNNGLSVIVGWSFYSPEFSEYKNKLHYIKSQISDAAVVHLLGGVHASAEPKLSLQAGFDLVAIGEGENTIINFLSRFIQGISYAHLKGLAYIKENQFISNGTGEQIELNDYPPFSERYRKFNPIEITRGCIYACKFCQTPFMFKSRFRHRSVENICYYIKILKKYGLRDIRFITPTALSYGSNDESVDLDKLEHLLYSVRSVIGTEGKIYFGSFPSEIRPEHITPRALQILKKYVNNDNLIIGAQSGSARLLKSTNRAHSVEDIIQAVRLTREFGFGANIDLIFGLPDESAEDIQSSLNLADQLISLGARIHGHTFMPLPGTPYQNSAPGKINPYTLKLLQKLESRGGLYGQWKKQLYFADELRGLNRRE